MPGILIPQRRTAQPQASIGFDRSNPITRKLCGAITVPEFGNGVISGPAPFVVMGAPFPSIGQNPYAGFYQVPPVTSDQWTFFCLAQIPSAADTAYTCTVDFWGDTDNRHAIQAVAYNDFSIGLDSRPNASDWVSGIFVPRDMPVMIVFTLDGPAGILRMFLNGVQMASDSRSVSPDPSTLHQISFGAKDNGGSDHNFSTTGTATSLAGFYSRVLSVPEVVSLSRNPWQIYKPRQT